MSFSLFFHCVIFGIGGEGGYSGIIVVAVGTDYKAGGSSLCCGGCVGGLLGLLLLFFEEFVESHFFCNFVFLFVFLSKAERFVGRKGGQD